ncbi:MAG: hypothetical protein DWI07_00100 [Planctomycetota bacterium]|nr:MAG: hypothetical protein DWI07_00100 [Planctomycetota bacterium]
MVKIQLATGYLDVKEGTAFPLTFQVGDIRDVSQRKGSFSKTITLTGSKNNNNLLNHYYDVNIIEGTFNINALTTGSVIQDGIPIMEDVSIQLTSVLKAQLTDGYEEHVEYEVLIKDSKADFFTAIANKELTDIDFSDFNHTYDAFNVVNRFDNTIVDGFKYFLPSNSAYIYSTQEFKPAIFARIYFDRIFAAAGFTYDWPTIAYDRFDKLFIPYNGGVDNFDYKDYLVKAEKTVATTISSTGASQGRTDIGAGTYIAPSSKVNITNWIELEDPQNIFNPITGVYTTPFNISSANAQQYDYQITMSYQLNIVNTNASACFGSFNGAAAAVFYKPYLIVSDATQALIPVNLYTNITPPANSAYANNAVECPLSVPGLSTTNILTQTIVTTLPLTYLQLNQLSSGTLGINVQQQNIQINNVNNLRLWRLGSVTGAFPTLNTLRIQAVITSIQLSIVPSSTVVAIGGTIDVNDYVPKKIKQSDFIKSIFNMFNLYASVDNTQPNKLLLQNRDDFYDSGAEVDWTAKLAKDQEQNLSFLPEITAKKVILTYAPDKDDPNTTYTNATNDIYGQVEVVFDNEYVKEVDTKPLLFSPTPVIKTLFGAFVPMIAGAAPQTNIRILYDKTEVGQPLATCGPFSILDYGSVGQSNLTSYPLVGHFDDPLTPSFDINYAICDFYFYQPFSLTDNNLYNRYWRRTMGQINNGKMLIANFNLKENDIQALRLNDKIRIDNSWWNINKVIDYDANANKLTRVELISIDNEINFTPFMGPGGPIIPTPPASIGPMQMLAMSNINTTRMITSNVFSNQATAQVMGRGNVIVNGTKSVVVGDGYIVSENTLVGDNLRASTFNGVPVGITPLVYTATLTQVGIGDPIAQVINDTIGGITWTRSNVGEYVGYLDGYNIGDIVVPFFTVMINNVFYDGIVSTTYLGASNEVYITTSQIGTGYIDGYLINTTIEIKYYT